MLLGSHFHVLNDLEFSDTTIELVLYSFLVSIHFHLFSCWLILFLFVFHCLQTLYLGLDWPKDGWRYWDSIYNK